jgi:hypothetical protein
VKVTAEVVVKIWCTVDEADALAKALMRSVLWADHPACEDLLIELYEALEEVAK